LGEVVIGVVDVRDDEGLDDRVEHLLRHRGVAGGGGRILCLSHTFHCAHCRVDLRTMQPDVSSDLNDLEGTLTTIERVLDLDELGSRARELEDQAADPSLWDDPDHAQQVTSELSRVQAKLKKIRELRQRLEDLPVLYNMAEEEATEDPAAAEDATAMAEEARTALRAAIESLEITTMLSGEYDQREALVNIRSGAGGVDAADWAEMLLRMYTRWAEQHGHKADIYDISYAEEAGIKSATFVIHGD